MNYWGDLLSVEEYLVLYKISVGGWGSTLYQKMPHFLTVCRSNSSFFPKVINQHKSMSILIVKEQILHLSSHKPPELTHNPISLESSIPI